METWRDGSTDPENNIAGLSQHQHQSTLLHFAASRGLRRVALFLLQQPGGREALRQADAQGDSPVCLAKRKGHQQLTELLTEYETSSPDLQVKSEDHLHIHPGGQAFQHYPSLGTYSLTLPTCQEREGGGEQEDRERSRKYRLQEEVKELRGLIQLYRDKKGNPDLCNIIIPSPTSPHLSSNHGLGSPAGGAWPCSNGQPEREEAAGVAAASLENCCRAREKQGSWPLLEERQEGEGCTGCIVSVTSHNTGGHLPIQVEEEAGRETPAADWHKVHSKKNRKRTTKKTTYSTKTTGKDNTVRESLEATTSGPGSEGTLLPIEPLVVSAFNEKKSMKTTNHSDPKETPIPRKLSSGLDVEVKGAGSTAVVVVTTSVEKQEGGNSELGLNVSDTETQKEKLTETTTQAARGRRTDPKPATESKAAMGQGQSQDSQSDPEDPAQTDSRNQSPQLGRTGSPKPLAVEGKPRRVLWRDGGWTGREMAPNAVWYQDENKDRTLNEGIAVDSHRKTLVSHTVWYDSEAVGQTLTENGQLEQESREPKGHGLRCPQTSGLSTPDPLEQGPSFEQLSSALSQLHGTQPAASHGPSTQRQEVHGTQREERGREAGGGQERKEGGALGGGEEVDDRKKANDGESGEREEAEERGAVVGGSEEKGEKGRKKRRKKRGKRGGAESKLSSSSSLDSPTQTERQTHTGTERQTHTGTGRQTGAQSEVLPGSKRESGSQSHRERETNPSLQTDTETQPEAQAKTGSADFQSPSPSESGLRKEADTSTMRLPSQTEGEDARSPGPSCALSNPDPGSTAPELSQMDLGAADIPKFAEISDSPEPVESNRPFEPVEPRAPTDNMEPTELLESKDFDVAIETVSPKELVESNFTKELPFKHSDPNESTEALGHSEFPEHKREVVESTEHTNSAEPVERFQSKFKRVDSMELPEYDTQTAETKIPNNPVQPGEPLESIGTSIGFMEYVEPREAMECSEHVEPRIVPFRGAADVTPLQKQEGSAETTGSEYLEHCLSAESPEEEQREEKLSMEENVEAREGEEETSEERREATKNKERVSEERQHQYREDPVDTNTENDEEISGTNEMEENRDRKLSDTHIEKEERWREEERGSEEDRKEDIERMQSSSRELAATAVAVVTVAIASAVANIELTQGLAYAHSESRSSTQSSSREQAMNQPLADATREQREQDAEEPAETEHQLTKHSHIEPLTQFISKQAGLDLTTESNTVVLTQVDSQCAMDDKPLEKDNQLPAQWQNKVPTQLGSSGRDNPEQPTQRHREDINAPTVTENQLLHLDSELPKKTGSLGQAETQPFTESNKIVTPQLDSQSCTQTESELHQDSQPPCPNIDTGQRGKVSDVFDSHSAKDPRLCQDSSLYSLSKDESVCKKGSEIGDRPESYFQGNETREASTAASLVKIGGEVHRQDNLDVVDSVCNAEERESSEEGVRDTRGYLYSDSQRCERAHVDDVIQGDEVIPSLLPPCEITLPVTLSDSSPLTPPLHTENGMAHANSQSEELTIPMTLDSSKSQPLPEMGPFATPLEIGSGTIQCEAHHSTPMDNEDGMFQHLEENSNTLDTVDGWKERERERSEEREGARSDPDPVQDRSQTEPGTSPAAREQPLQTETVSDSAHSLEIQRERETFYPLQPCPESCTPPLPNTAPTTCTDVRPSLHQDRDCVSVCVLQKDTAVSKTQSLTVSTELDDSVFKKPEEPVPGLEDRARGVCVSWSSTDDSSSLGPLSASSLASHSALSAGTGDPAAPWKPGTEEGGGEGGGGEEEERKDQLTENPVTSAILRASIRSLSPFRRHSWEPGRNNPTGDTDLAQRSSLKSLSAEVKRTKPALHRRSMSWCPSNLPRPDQEQVDNRSYSLEGLEVEKGAGQASCPSLGVSEREERSAARGVRLDSQERCGGSLVSLTEEDQEGDASSIDSQSSHRVVSMTTSCPAMSHHQTLTKSISMVTISHRETDGTGSFSSTSGSLEYSISEEEPGPLRSDSERREGGTKVSRTFSYLRNKMTKKNKEKDKERRGEKERESKEKERKTVNGHLFSPVAPPSSSFCQQCAKPLNTKEVFFCSNCGAHVHKNCRESLSVCTKGKIKQQSLVPEAVPGSAVNMRSKSTSSSSSVSSSSSSRDRWSTLTSPDEQVASVFPRRNPSILSFNTHSNLSKSISTSNIAGLDDVPLKALKFLSQSTDSLHQGSKVNASTESLTDEGTEMMDSQLMGEFEYEVKDLEADSWSATVDKKFLKLHKKDEVKRQDVIYELYQTEFHHVRTLRIMSEVYYKGIQKELQLDSHTLDKIFPMLDDLLDTHTHFLSLLLERKRASLAEGRNNILICSIGDILVHQFSGGNAERMKKVYGKFCSRHNEAVNLYKELHAKDKRFQALTKRMMSSSIVRRLSIPECILLVTQRITKYPVLIQRILQHTRDADEDHACVSDALRCVKELIAAVDSKVNEQEKKRRLREVYSRTDSKSIMRMKSGQMFAKEDLIRGRRLLHDGALQLKNTAGRLKDVHAMLLSDVLVFLQEKDQKYVFASLDQRSTVISLQKLIVREVANEERGLFLITAGTERPEMVEVLASSKDERNTWMTIIQDAMHSMEKDEDEGVPSETEEDRRQQENRVKEIRELLRRKDDQIISLLEEKVHIFRDLCDCNPSSEDPNPPIRERMLFRATPDDITKGEPIMKDALREVEILHTLVNSGVGVSGCSTPSGLTGGSVGPVCLPRRAETFGGFDSHQMNSAKNGEKEEGDDALDLRRTESDSVLKKGATTSLQMLLKRNSEQVQHSVTNLHDLLTSLQAVVVQQDSVIEDQRQALNDRPATNPSSRHSSSSSLSSCSSSRPSSLIEQEKQRSLERQRQEAASLQKQQAAHQEEKKRREKEWEVRERGLVEREERLRVEEEEAGRRRKELDEEREELHRRKEEYQRDLERLREAQRRLERDKEALRRDMEAMRKEESGHLQRYQRTPSTTSEDSLRFHSSGSLDLEPREAPEQPKEVELSSSAPTKEPFLRIGSKRMGKNFNPFSSSSKPQGGEKDSQLPTRLLQLAKPKEKKEKKKKKGKGGEQTQTEGQATVTSQPQNDGDIFFC
ncbi:uncharacterized protein ACJ7VT_008478 [Polymixia lowei]